MRHGRRMNHISRMDAARALRLSLEELGWPDGHPAPNFKQFDVLGSPCQDHPVR